MPQLDLLPTDEPLTPAEESEQKQWMEKLRLRLKDPEFRKSPGFPIGTNEAILSLSAPPYYTACPNPFLTEILEEWERENKKEIGYKNQQSEYHRDPFASDVSEGKNDPIYNAHSYHTKVPHKAIMRYILHYTEPGDIVLDGFCGTGMTGVASQLCGDKKTVESLGYGVDKDGNITLPVEKPSAEETKKEKSLLSYHSSILFKAGHSARRSCGPLTCRHFYRLQLQYIGECAQLRTGNQTHLGGSGKGMWVDV